jgi:hypothetical protein
MRASDSASAIGGFAGSSGYSGQAEFLITSTKSVR